VQLRDVALRVDAQRNRERILEVALAELTRYADTPLSVIAKKAGVGQGTLYRNFRNREALLREIYYREVQQFADSATELLSTRDPDRALREWMEQLARNILEQTALSDALRHASIAPPDPDSPNHTPVLAAMERLLQANEQAGMIRPGVTAQDLILATAGLWQIDRTTDWRSQAARLLDLVMDGLRAGAPRHGER